MLAALRTFVVKYLSSLTEDEVKLLLQDLALLPAFQPFAAMVNDVLAAVKVAQSLEEPAAAPVADLQADSQ